MSVPFSNTKLRVPQGFQTLLEALTREILRNKPTNIYEFAAGYLENLSKDKKEGKIDDIVKQSLLDDRLHNNHSFKESYSLNNKNVESAAVIIQSSFRGHQTREQLDNEKPATDRKPEVATTVKAAEHKQEEHKPQESHQKQQTQNDETSLHEFNNNDVKLQRRAKSPNENTEALKKEEDINTAAVIIQSTFRGYKARKELEEKGNQQSNNDYINEDHNQGENNMANEGEDDDDIRNEAATRIQATFRGFQTRRQLSESPNKKPE